MNEPNFETQDAEHSDVDADVVCEQCNTVNEPGTLICRQCGNNLRDQRHLRLAMQEEDAAGPRPIRMLGGLLSALGLLVILWVTLNVGDIENWLVGVQAETDRVGAQFWTGPRSANFDAMASDLAQLRATPPTADSITAAQSTPVPEDTYEGVYILAYQDANIDTAMGYAKVRRANDELQFVALLNRGDEIRGTASIESNERIVTSNAVADRRGLRTSGVGFAQRNAQGGFTVYGAADQSEGQFQILAFRLSE